MNFREERRRDRQVEAEAETARLKAQAEAEAVRTAAMAEQQRQADRDRRAADRQAKKDREADVERRRQRRRDALARVRGWAGRHVVDLLIYPIALVAFALAAPAMAAYGTEIYGGEASAASWLGAGLPVITELAMWAFALAVQITRTRTPQRSTARLQVGVWAFGGVAFALNLVHGLDTRWDHGVVMGLVAISGVVAHQLTVAAPPRSRAERIEARIARRADRKVARIRRAAVRQAAAEVDADGRARLVYRPGRYDLAGRVRPRLDPAEVDPDAPPSGWTELDHELAALVESTPRTGVDDGPDEPGDDTGGGGVATLDRNLDAPQTSSGNAESKRPRVGGRRTRSLDELRAELHRLVQSGEVDPTSAESIRHGLRCAKRAAQTLRDEYTRRT